MQGKDDVTVVTDPWAALEGAHAVAILTEWDEFKTLDWQKALDVMQRPGAAPRLKALFLRWLRQMLRRM